MIGVISVFTASLFGIVFLLTFKAWELRRERTVASAFRTRLDEFAIRIKGYIESVEHMLARLPSLLTLFLLEVLGRVTVKLARMTKGASEAAYRLADFISHKHNFERKEIRSEFLKTMIEHKNGLTQPVLNAVKSVRRKRSKKESVQVQEADEASHSPEVQL